MTELANSLPAWYSAISGVILIFNTNGEIFMKAMVFGLIVLSLVGCGGGNDDSMDAAAEDEGSISVRSAHTTEAQLDPAINVAADTTLVEHVAEYDTENRKRILAVVIKKETSGIISVNGVERKYQVRGGYRRDGDESFSVSSPATKGDYEILQFGASRGGGDSEKDQYFNFDDIKAQGFKPIRVRGTQDKKIEMWYRKNSGQTSFKTAKRAQAYSLLVLQNADGKLNIDFDKIKVDTEYSDMQACKEKFNKDLCYVVPSEVRKTSGFKVLGYFSDDSVQLTSVGEGKLVYQDWGFGDGDGMHMILYRRSQTPPQFVRAINHAPQGKQYVAMMVVFPEK